MWPFWQLKPYPGNPRHNNAGVDAVAALVREFVFRQPCSVDEQDVSNCDRAHPVQDRTQGRAGRGAGARCPRTASGGGRAYRIADNQTATLSA